MGTMTASPQMCFCKVCHTACFDEGVLMIRWYAKHVLPCRCMFAYTYTSFTPQHRSPNRSTKSESACALLHGMCTTEPLCTCLPHDTSLLPSSVKSKFTVRHLWQQTGWREDIITHNPMWTLDLTHTMGRSLAWRKSVPSYASTSPD